jgi:non-canonical purine NTP pyrophosphatase (RdgB/HAM1 family)
MEEFAKRLIIPDILLVREPANFGKCGILEKVENEKTISEKIEERLGFEFNPKKIITVPFFEQNEIDYLGTYLRERLKPILQKPKKQIFIGSNNQSKIIDWTNYLTDFEVFWPNKLNLKMEVEENMTSLVENSQKKAKAWAKVSGMLTLSEDTGFFIPELGGLPGVSVKKWGGELDKELQNAEFLEFFYNKVKDLKDLNCYFETVFSFADTKGLVQNITFQTHGRVDLTKFDNIQNPDYPLSAVFVANGRTTSWSELTVEEKIEFDKPMIDKVKEILENFKE